MADELKREPETIKIKDARRGQVREVRLKDGKTFKLTVIETTGTKCVLEIEPGDAVESVYLKE